MQHQEQSCRMTPRFPTVTPEAVVALRERIGEPVPRPEACMEAATPDAIRHWMHRISDRNPFWLAVLRRTRSCSPWTPAPSLGEHHKRVFEGLLGLKPQKYPEHQAQGVVR
jgi:hypothetical protein